MELRYTLNGEEVVVQLEAGDSGYTATVGNRAYTVTVEPASRRPGELLLTVDGVPRLAWVAADGAQRWVAMEGQTLAFTVAQPAGRSRKAQAGGAGALEAQMPGVVRRVLVAAGERVERGQALMLLEAMKMEIRVSAPLAGVVEAVAVNEGQVVERGQTLVRLQASA